MKVKRIIALLIGMVIIIILFYTYSEFNGNPFVKLQAKQKINDYLTNHFVDLDFDKSNIYFNFKDGSYYMNIDIKHSEDQDFSISYKKGEVETDYEWRVNERNNTDNRLQIYLNEDRWNDLSQQIFKESYNFSLITVNREFWENNLPELDMTIDEMLKKYPFEITIYLHDNEQFKESDYEGLKKQVYQNHKKHNIDLSNITIESLN